MKRKDTSQATERPVLLPWIRFYCSLGLNNPCPSPGLSFPIGTTEGWTLLSVGAPSIPVFYDSI